MTTGSALDRESRTRQAIRQEALFRPLNTAILALTVILAFLLPGYWWVVTGVGILAWAGSVFATLRNPRTQAKALAQMVTSGVAAAQSSSDLQTQEIAIILDTLIHSVRRKLPKDVLGQVDSIRSSILEILPRVEALEGIDHNRYAVRQIAMSYLPETLENYMKLPQEMATQKEIRGGRTAHQLLQEQLGLLDGELKEIIDDIDRADTRSLLAHGRFLEDKFGQSDQWLAGN